jgi:predicted molibdopterin-dependent oxidoreductase YjgC
MRYELIYTSPFTRYTVDECLSLADCERVCQERFDRLITFTREKDGVLKAQMHGDEQIVLSAREIEG